jgi:hypothetical protein
MAERSPEYVDSARGPAELQAQASVASNGLTVVIQLELGRDGAQPDVVGFILPLVGDPGVDPTVEAPAHRHSRRDPTPAIPLRSAIRSFENTSPFIRKRAVGVERLERGLERARHGRDLGERLGR